MWIETQKRTSIGTRESAAAIVLGLSQASLGVARSLGRRGIAVFGVDKDGTRIGTKSRWTNFLGSPTNDKGLTELLLDFSASSNSKAVLYLLDDEYLLFFSRHAGMLRRHFSCPYPNHLLLGHLVSKETMAAVFNEAEIPTPHTVVLNGKCVGKIEELALSFPLILKPNLHERWLGNAVVKEVIGNRKALLVSDAASLKDYWSVLSSYDTMVAQEFIPGETKNLYYYVGYRNDKGKILASFVGRKLRTFPDKTGSECFLQSVDDLCVRRFGEEVLTKLNYIGPAGVDLKFDARDGCYKVIEINCRLGISDGLPVACGVDIPYIYYKDVQGAEVQPSLAYEKNVYWLWLEKDIEWFYEYKSKDGFTILKWWTHFLTNKYSYAVFARDDLKPFFYSMGNLVKRLLKKLVRSLVKSLPGRIHKDGCESSERGASWLMRLK